MYFIYGLYVWSTMELFFDFQVGQTFDGKAKTLAPHWSVYSAFIPWNSKNMWFCLCENEFYIVVIITAKQANILC